MRLKSIVAAFNKDPDKVDPEKINLLISRLLPQSVYIADTVDVMEVTSFMLEIAEAVNIVVQSEQEKMERVTFSYLSMIAVCLVIDAVQEYREMVQTFLACERVSLPSSLAD